MFALLAAVASLLVLSSPSAQAAQFNVVNTYNGANCTGAVNSTFVQGPSGGCTYVTSTSSMKNTCGTLVFYLNSTTCQGEGTDGGSQGTSCSSTQDPSVNSQVQCKDYSSVVEFTFSTSCNFTASESNKFYVPLGTCMPSPSNPGGAFYSGSSNFESFKASKSGSGFTLSSYSTAACTGTANTTAVATETGCTEVSVPALGDGPISMRAKLYGSSAQSLMSSAMLLLVVLAASFW